MPIHPLLRRSCLACFGATALATGGCAHFWDDVTSRDFEVKAWFVSEDPVSVLETSTDGDKRAAALRRLQEPAANGGSAAAQDKAIGLLTQAAVSDPQPVCKIAAIATLGRYRDPRAAQVLIAAFENASKLQADFAVAVQTQVVAALGESKQPAAGAFLLQVVRTPPSNDLSEREKSATRDVRLAAVRALKDSKPNAETAAALAKVAQTDRDVAMRDRSRDAFVALTGQEPPASATQPPVPEKPTIDSTIRAVENRVPGSAP